jgi:hypothetical protein
MPTLQNGWPGKTGIILTPEAAASIPSHPRPRSGTASGKKHFAPALPLCNNRSGLMGLTTSTTITMSLITTVVPRTFDAAGS